MYRLFPEDSNEEQLQDEYDNFVAKYWVGLDTPLGVVITGSLYLENNINRLLTLLLEKPERILKLRVAQKLDVLEALGEVPAESLHRLRGLNKMRNQFAHDLEHQVTYKDIAQLKVPTLDKVRWNKDNLDTIKFAFSFAMGTIHAQVLTLEEKKK